MATVIATHRTSKSPEAILKALHDFPNMHKYTSAVHHSEQTAGGEMEIGAERVCHFNPSGSRHANERLAAFDDESITIEIFGGSIPITSTSKFSVKPAGSGSELTFHGEVNMNGFLGGLKMALAKPLFKKQSTQILREIAENA